MKLPLSEECDSASCFHIATHRVTVNCCDGRGAYFCSYHASNLEENNERNNSAICGMCNKRINTPFYKVRKL